MSQGTPCSSQLIFAEKRMSELESTNGLDHDYFAKKLNIIARDASNFTPQEMARELGRLVTVTGCDTDEITQLRQRVKELEEDISERDLVIDNIELTNRKWDRLFRERSDRIAELEVGQGEPVAKVAAGNLGNRLMWATEEAKVDTPVGTKLYTSAPRIPDGWQPIETAPRDDTAVLAKLTKSDIPMPVRFRNGEWVVTWDGYVLSNADGPTHWMPLPEAPKQEDV